MKRAIRSNIINTKQFYSDPLNANKILVYINLQRKLRHSALYELGGQTWLRISSNDGEFISLQLNKLSIYNRRLFVSTSIK